MVRLPETAQLRAPAAPDSFARLPIAKRPAARQRLRPDAENFGGGDSFLACLFIGQYAPRRCGLAPFLVPAPGRRPGTTAALTGLQRARPRAAQLQPRVWVCGM